MQFFAARDYDSEYESDDYMDTKWNYSTHNLNERKQHQVETQLLVRDPKYTNNELQLQIGYDIPTSEFCDDFDFAYARSIHLLEKVDHLKPILMQVYAVYVSEIEVPDKDGWIDWYDKNMCTDHAYVAVKHQALIDTLNCFERFPERTLMISIQQSLTRLTKKSYGVPDWYMETLKDQLMQVHGAYIDCITMPVNPIEWSDWYKCNMHRNHTELCVSTPSLYKNVLNFCVTTQVHPRRVLLSEIVRELQRLTGRPFSVY